MVGLSGRCSATTVRLQMSVVSYVGRGVVRRTRLPSSSTASMLLPFRASVTTDSSLVRPFTRLKLAIIFRGTAGQQQPHTQDAQTV